MTQTVTRGQLRANGATDVALARSNILAAAAHGIETFIERQGGDARRVLVQAGIPEARLGDPNVALDLPAYIGLMELSALETRNDNFGLWFGQQFQPDKLGLIGQIALNSPTLGAALGNLVDLFPYHQQTTETRLVQDDDLLRLEYRVVNGAILERRQDAELTLGMFANIFRSCLGARWSPELVLFEHMRPEAWRDHERAFDAPVHFGQRTNAIVFRARRLDMPMRHSDGAKLRLLRNELVGLAGGTGTLSFIERIRAEIRSALPEGYPHIEAVAHAVNLPRWTLQRRLAETGYTFSDLIERVRRELAVAYLLQRHLPITEISFALGYSELSAFSRAFSKWYGFSPQALRTDPRISGGVQLQLGSGDHAAKRLRGNDERGSSNRAGKPGRPQPKPRESIVIELASLRYKTDAFDASTFALGDFFERRPTPSLPGPAILVESVCAPGDSTAPHYYPGYSLVMILEGSWELNGTIYPSGTVILTESKAVRGELRPGPQGVREIGFFESTYGSTPFFVDADDDRNWKMLEQMPAQFAYCAAANPPGPDPKAGIRMLNREKHGQESSVLTAYPCQLGPDGFGAAINANDPHRYAVLTHFKPGAYIPRHRHSGWCAIALIDGDCKINGVKRGPEVTLMHPPQSPIEIEVGPTGARAMVYFESGAAAVPIFDDPSDPVATEVLELCG